MTKPIYVETRVRGDLDRLWAVTQDAGSHTRWDVRFTSISDVQLEDDQSPRAFRYELRFLGRTIAGTGTSVGERRRPDGTRTSALHFQSPDPLSLIRRGSGWWRYVPVLDGGTRFLTGYDYEPGWGRAGWVLDRLVFRRLLGWGTAWSFDRLRMWVEDDLPPETALRRGLLDAGLRASAVGAAVVGLRRSWLGGLPALLLLVPPLPGAPRASRCLRQPPDRVGRTAPGSLETLAAPA